MRWRKWSNDGFGSEGRQGPQPTRYPGVSQCGHQPGIAPHDTLAVINADVKEAQPTQLSWSALGKTETPWVHSKHPRRRRPLEPVRKDVPVKVGGVFTPRALHKARQG